MIANMKIKKISIERYKSIIDPITLENFSNLQILVGPNNAGKTNILDAIHLFFDSLSDEERFSDKASEIGLVLDFEGKSRHLKYKNDQIIGDTGKISERFIRIGDSSSIYSLIPEKLKEFKEKHPREYELFSSALREYFKGVEISEKLFVSSVRADHGERPIKRMGEGFKRLFVILFYAFHPRYDIILIDEPEAHLHPSMIKRFLFILAEKKLQNQIFLTTHHPTFIQADYLKYVWRVARNENGSTAVYGFPGPSADIDRLIQEINDDNSGMFFADKVLLVEGVSDHIFMREIIKKFYKKTKDIKVVYAGGKGSIDIYAELCGYFSIPCAIMMDRDALRSPSLQRVRGYPKESEKMNGKEIIDALKKQEIFILRQTLEDLFPKKYRKKETKPLTSLYVSRKMTEDDFKSKKMSPVGEILEII